MQASLQTTGQKKQKQQYVDNTIEAIVNATSNTYRTGLDQILGHGSYERNHKTHGVLREGQELNLNALAKPQEKPERNKRNDILPGFDYKNDILRSGEQKITRENAQELQVQIQEIIIELKKLISQSQELQIEYKEVVVDQRIAKPGKYHKSFFAWVLEVVKAARMQIEDSGAWLNAFKSKKGQRQYWAMFKKHGTTFGLSNERTVATQTG